MNVPVRRGMLLRHQGHYYFVEEIVERHSGKQRPTVHVTLRDALDGRRVDRTVDELTPIEELPARMRPMQYLYSKGSRFFFMDSETFEEVELGDAQLRGAQPFLSEGQEYRVLFAGEQPLALELPEQLALRVASTAAPTHAVGTSANIMKEATLENGLVVRVPLFIKTGDRIRVDTRSKTYTGKEQES